MEVRRVEEWGQRAGERASAQGRSPPCGPCRVKLRLHATHGFAEFAPLFVGGARGLGQPRALLLQLAPQGVDQLGLRERTDGRAGGCRRRRRQTQPKAHRRAHLLCGQLARLLQRGGHRLERGHDLRTRPSPRG